MGPAACAQDLLGLVLGLLVRDELAAGLLHGTLFLVRARSHRVLNSDQGGNHPCGEAPGGWRLQMVTGNSVASGDVR